MTWLLTSFPKDFMMTYVSAIGWKSFRLSVMDCFWQQIINYGGFKAGRDSGLQRLVENSDQLILTVLHHPSSHTIRPWSLFRVHPPHRPPELPPCVTLLWKAGYDRAAVGFTSNRATKFSSCQRSVSHSSWEVARSVAGDLLDTLPHLPDVAPQMVFCPSSVHWLDVLDPSSAEVGRVAKMYTSQKYYSSHPKNYTRV